MTADAWTIQQCYELLDRMDGDPKFTVHDRPHELVSEFGMTETVANTIVAAWRGARKK